MDTERNTQFQGLVADMHWSVWGLNRDIPVRVNIVKGIAKPIVARVIQSHLPVPRVLDVGSGNDKMARALEAIGFTGIYETLDTDPQVQAMYRDLDEVEGKYDAITMLEVIEHLRVPEVIYYIERLRKLMQANGLLIISTPDPSHPTWFFEDISHVQHYPYRDLVAILQNIGFRTIEVYRLAERVPLKKFPPVIRELVAILGYATRNLLTRLTSVNFETKTLIFVATPLKSMESTNIQG